MKEVGKEEKIQWIVTVPAIWSDEAKEKMKTWIIKCIIVYEPDSAGKTNIVCHTCYLLNDFNISFLILYSNGNS